MIGTAKARLPSCLPFQLLLTNSLVDIDTRDDHQRTIEELARKGNDCLLYCSIEDVVPHYTMGQALLKRGNRGTHQNFLSGLVEHSPLQKKDLQKISFNSSRLLEGCEINFEDQLNVAHKTDCKYFLTILL